MLSSLHISNYALIDNLDVAFEPGLNIITGETGAGKSIMLGALGLLLGARADTRVVRDKERKSVIEATFTTVEGAEKLRRALEEKDVDWVPEALILRREIAPSGSRSRAFINDTPVSVADLQAVAVQLVDIHSQHQNLLLASPPYQLQVLDALADNEQRLSNYQKAYSQLRQAVRKFKEARATLEKDIQDREFLISQYQQLEKASLSDPEELDELEAERTTVANAAQIQEAFASALNALDGDNSAIELLREAQNSTQDIASLCGDESTLVELANRLEAVRIETQDIYSTLEEQSSGIGTDPNRLEEIDERISELYGLLRRHHVQQLSELIALREKLKERLDILELGDQELRQLQAAARLAKQEAEKAAAELTAARKEQAQVLAQTLRDRAMPLGMKNLQVDIQVRPTPLGSTGADEVEFLFAFNKNQTPLPVGNTASGGEISRLMLALKSIVADRMALPTIIFDEVDTGVSGDVANRMAQMMLQIADNIQVIAITHLPQVAARGQAHFKVYKEDTETATTTRVRQLVHDERLSEIALMLTGNASDPAALLTAKSLLDA